MERGTIYPSWRYHPSGKSCLVRNAAEDDALASEWSDKDVRFTAVPEPVVSDTIELAVEQDSPLDPPKRKPGRPRKDA